MKKKLVIIIAMILSLIVFIAIILTAIDRRIIRKAVPVKGRIAIVIDDWGYHLNNLAVVGTIKQPLTCAILPGLKNSRAVAQRLHSLGLEIILHLPMEPKEKYRLEKDTVLVTMNEQQIHSIFNKDLATILFAKGVSNHMGSRITENKKSSAMVISEARKHKLYFLDSFVTPNSVCAPLAKKIGLRFAKRDIFLDNRDDPAYIRGQLIKLRDLAAKMGEAIGIGHDRKNTLMVLKEMLPQLENDGYRFVFVSEIAG